MKSFVVGRCRQDEISSKLSEGINHCDSTVTPYGVWATLSDRLRPPFSFFRQFVVNSCTLFS